MTLPGTSVLYLRGTTNEHVPATIVGSSSEPKKLMIGKARTQKWQLRKFLKFGRYFYPWSHLYLKENGLLGRGCGQLQPSTP